MDPATAALLRHTVRRAVFSVRGLVFAAFAAFPWAVTLLLRILVARGVPVPLGGVSLYASVVLLYLFGFLLPLSTLVFGVGLVADDREGGTLPYLLGRPVPRAKIVLVRFFATVLLLWGLHAASAAGVFLLGVSEGGAGALLREAPVLLADLAVLALGVLTYGALFLLLGLLLRKPLFVGLLLGFGWENLVGYIPGFLKRLTLLFHLHTLLPHGAGPQGLVEQMLASTESRAAAFVFLVFYGVLFLVLSVLAMGRIEAPAAAEAEA